MVDVTPPKGPNWIGRLLIAAAILVAAYMGYIIGVATR